MRRNVLLLIIVYFLFPVLLFGQTMSLGAAAELETLLETPAVTSVQAVRFVITSASDPMSIQNDVNEIFQSTISNGWLPDTAPDTPITLDKLSFLIMKAFDIKGGLMYTLFPGPRYAYRTMTSRNFIQGITDPAMTVSGDEFLVILGRVLNTEGDEE
jgi:hypothetical protein